MAREIKIDLPSKGLDDLFSTQDQREDEKLERVRDIAVDEIDNFPEHPFQVRNDESMIELASSIAEHGVQTPITVREKEDKRYEVISGHRRKRACEVANIKTIPAIVRNMSRDEAVIFMVDSNLQREKILPSEKAFSYKMKLEAIRRQAGRPSKDNSAPMEQNLIGIVSRDIVAEEAGESKSQIQRYIRLTELIPPILEMVDNNRIAFRPSVELSYLPKEKQEILHEIMEADECTPSLAQAIKMKQFEQNDKLSEEVILSIMSEEKPNQIEQFKMPKNRIARFFPPGTKKETAIETIVKALEMYQNRDRAKEQERDRGMER